MRFLKNIDEINFFSVRGNFAVKQKEIFNEILTGKDRYFLEGL